MCVCNSFVCNVIIFSVLLAQLTTLAVLGYQTVLYQSYVRPESLSNISQHDLETATSAMSCASDCTRKEDCDGFTYDWLTKKCSGKTCVNPNLYSEGEGNGYYIRTDIGERFNKLLARGE